MAADSPTQSARIETAVAPGGTSHSRRGPDADARSCSPRRSGRGCIPTPRSRLRQAASTCHRTKHGPRPRTAPSHCAAGDPARVGASAGVFVGWRNCVLLSRHFRRHGELLLFQRQFKLIEHSLSATRTDGGAGRISSARPSGDNRRPSIRSLSDWRMRIVPGTLSGASLLVSAAAGAGFRILNENAPL